MSFFEDASLVLIPSAQKTSKVYSVKPTDGTGDLTFTRSNDTATRVGPDGLIEKVRTNLALYSEDWTNWTLFQSTATANTTANPLTGTLTADTLTISTSTTGVSYRAVSTGLNVATFSAYLKAGTHNFAQIGFTDSTDYAVNIDLTLGTIVGVSSGITGTITSVGSGWYRVTATRTIATTSTPNVFVNIISGTVGSTIIVYGAQVELGDIATDYIATTTAAVSVGPVANVPRLDYLNSSCPRLLLEGQRSNLVTYSEQLNNILWDNAGGAVVSANAVISPDGYQNADTATFAPASSILRQLVTGLTTSATYTFTVYVKKSATSGANNVRLTTNDTTSWSGAATVKVALTNSWQRVTLTYTSTGTSNYLLIGAIDNTGAYDSTCAGNVDVWGAQLEAGAYATSYIPTLGAAVTRGADAASKTGISSLIGQTEGVLFLDFVYNGIQNLYGNLINSEKNVTNSFYIHLGLDGNIRAGVFANSVQRELTASGFVVGQRYKLAFAYKTGELALYSNGVQKATSANSFTFNSSLDDIFLNDPTTYFGYQENVSFNQALLFKTRLTNAQLAELTTL